MVATSSDTSPTCVQESQDYRDDTFDQEDQASSVCLQRTFMSIGTNQSRTKPDAKAEMEDLEAQRQLLAVSPPTSDHERRLGADGEYSISISSPPTRHICSSISANTVL